MNLKRVTNENYIIEVIAGILIIPTTFAVMALVSILNPFTILLSVIAWFGIVFIIEFFIKSRNPLRGGVVFISSAIIALVIGIVIVYLYVMIGLHFGWITLSLPL